MTIKQVLKTFLVRHVLAYDAPQLVRRLRKLGIAPGSVLMLHSSWLPENGFAGRPVDFIRALQQAVGMDGILVMPSFTYHNKSSREFLAESVVMDVRRTPSRMGLITEVFRRMPDVHRSLSPTHPLLAWGKRAQWFLARHEDAVIPFGDGSPFARLLELKGKILTVDAPFSTITFTHFVEARLKASLPFDLFAAGDMQGTVAGYDGVRKSVPVRVLSEQSAALRREARLVAELRRHGLILSKRLGNTHLQLIDCAAMVACADAFVASGGSFFDAPSGAAVS